MITSPTFTSDNSKFPSISVKVPFVVPLTMILAPITGTFFLSASTTVPVTLNFSSEENSTLLTSSAFTIEVKSLTLTLEISLSSFETSGLAKAATATAANGSTYKYFTRAQGFDFFLIIIVIRFLSEL